MVRRTVNISKTILAYILYGLGHAISIPMTRFDLHFLYPIYNHLMLWSADFDVNEKIWKFPPKVLAWEFQNNKIDLYSDVEHTHLIGSIDNETFTAIYLERQNRAEKNLGNN